MQRITISLDDSLSEALDRMAQERGYASRSEAMRDLVRDGLERWQDELSEGGHCVANLSYIVDRRVRSLPQRIAEMQHAHHDLVATSTIVRLDHYHSLESVILKGTSAEVRAFADAIRSERGIRFGAINMLQVMPTDEHEHDDDHDHHGHHHLSPMR
jgi:CopG family transcriptional regulator, nickel-responsive regulator